MLRSLESNIRAFVNFTNTSERLIEVHWINFNGEQIHYTNLEPGGTYVVSSRYCDLRRFIVSPFRSTRTALTLGYSCVPEPAKNYKWTAKKSSSLKLGSSTSWRLKTGWFPLDDKMQSFITLSNRYATSVNGSFCSSSNRAKTSSTLNCPRQSKPICFISLTTRRDSSKATKIPMHQCE